MKNYTRYERVAVEILAPLPALSHFHRIIDGGADRLYTGVAGLSRERDSLSPGPGELIGAAAKDPSIPPRLHLAINRVPGTETVGEALEVAGSLISSGYVNLIVNDHSLLRTISRDYPEALLCGSVGLGSVNPYDALFLSEIGASSIVLPITSGPEELRAIKGSTSLRVEVFAICRGEPIDQGTCMLTGYFLEIPNEKGERAIISAKRGGLCHTICRGVVGKAPKHDITGDIDAWIRAGADLFKIEGRYRRVDEILGMVSRVRRAIDNIWV